MTWNLIQCIFSNEQKVMVQTMLIPELLSQPTQGGAVQLSRAWHLCVTETRGVRHDLHGLASPCFTGSGGKAPTHPTAPALPGNDVTFAQAFRAHGSPGWSAANAACPSRSLKSWWCSESVQTQSSTNLALLVLLCLLFYGYEHNRGILSSIYLKRPAVILV